LNFAIAETSYSSILISSCSQHAASRSLLVFDRSSIASHYFTMPRPTILIYDNACAGDSSDLRPALPSHVLPQDARSPSGSYHVATAFGIRSAVDTTLDFVCAVFVGRTERRISEDGKGAQGNRNDAASRTLMLSSGEEDAYRTQLSEWRKIRDRLHDSQTFEFTWPGRMEFGNRVACPESNRGFARRRSISAYLFSKRSKQIGI
jgi:hypothetical protein